MEKAGGRGGGEEEKNRGEKGRLTGYVIGYKKGLNGRGDRESEGGWIWIYTLIDADCM